MFFKNLAFAFGAQGIQLLQSVLIALLLPKFLGVEGFGFWQLFIFYTQYGGFLHFGLIDGIYLKYGGYRYNDLNFGSLAVQFRWLTLFQCVILCLAGYFISSEISDINRLFVIGCSCIFIIIQNSITYFSQLLQAVNRIKEFSVGRIVSVIFFILLSILFYRRDSYQGYIIAYICGNILTLIYYVFCCKEIFLSVFIKKQEDYLKECYANIKQGLVLVLSNISSMLILGVGRWLVDMHWGITYFSKISMMLMLVNFFLLFISQTSLVLFPTARRWDYGKLRKFYADMNEFMGIFVPCILILYLPICLLVNLWLPQYADATRYLIYLMPLCVFDSKMQLLYNTSYKVLNKVKSLLLCNILSVIISTFMISISIYLLENVVCVVASMLLAIWLRSVIAGYLLNKEFTVIYPRNVQVTEFCLVVSFIAIYELSAPEFGSLLYLLIIMLVCFLHRHRISAVIEGYLNEKK